MKRLLAAIAAVDGRDVVLVAGVALIWWGAAGVWGPRVAALVVGGILLGLVILGQSLRARRQERKER